MAQAPGVALQGAQRRERISELQDEIGKLSGRLTRTKEQCNELAESLFGQQAKVSVGAEESDELILGAIPMANHHLRMCEMVLADIEETIQRMISELPGSTKQPQPLR